MQAPVLVIGGSGVVGSRAVRTLRKLQPHLPIAVGGRDVAKAARIADEIGNAVAIEVDVSHPDLGLRDGQPVAAMAVFLKDERLNAMRVAQRRGVPYVSLSSGAFEIGPEVAGYLHAPGRAPIVLASHWLAGAALFPALHQARQFGSVESIRIGVLVDDEDLGGPAAHADYERIVGSAPAALTVSEGRFVWRRTDGSGASFVSVDGRRVEAQPYSPFDIMSLAVATDARDVSLDFAYTASASKLRGEPFSTEIVIDIAGRLPGGEHVRRRLEIVHPDGQAALTALCVALLLERAIGAAGGPAPAPGLYFPELLLHPGDVLRRMQEFGARFQAGSSEAAA